MSMKEYNRNQKRAVTRKQSDDYDKSGIDPFSRAPAGYGLTQSPGKWPWDNPPEIVDVDDAFENIKERMMVPEQRYDLLRLMDAGIAIETLVRTATFGAFTQGLITPDVAEMLNIPLSAHLLVEADRAGITPKFNNNVKLDVLPDKEIADIMRSLNPERFMEYVEGKANPSAEEAPAEPTKETMKGFMASMKEDVAQQENTDGN